MLSSSRMIDKETVNSMSMCYRILKVTVKPSGAIGVDVALSDQFWQNAPLKNCDKIGIILSDGNVDLGRYAFGVPW